MRIIMSEYDIKEIKQKLIKELEPKRYEHTIGVADTAFSLALRYGYDCEDAFVEAADLFSPESSIPMYSFSKSESVTLK